MSTNKLLKIAAYNELVKKANEIVPRFQEALWRNFGNAKVLKANHELTMKARDLFELKNSPQCMMFIGTRYGSHVDLTIRIYKFEGSNSDGHEERFSLGYVRDQILTEKAQFTPLKEIDFDFIASQTEKIKIAKIQLDKMMGEIPSCFRPDLRYV